MREWCGSAVEVSDQAQYQDRKQQPRTTLRSLRRLAVFTLTLVLVAGVHVAWAPDACAAPAEFVEQRITLNGLDADLTLERVGADYTVSVNYLDEAPARISVTVQQTLYDSSDGDLMSCVDTSWSDNVSLENGHAVFAPTVVGEHATLDLGELPLRSFQRVFINLETSAATSVVVHAVITDNWGTRHELRSPSRSIPAGVSTINQNITYMISSGSTRPQGLRQVQSVSLLVDGLDSITINSVVLTAPSVTVRPQANGQFEFTVPIGPGVEFSIEWGSTTRTFHLEDLVGRISLEVVAQLDLPMTTDVLVRVDANPEAGFYWPYFLFVPAGVRDQPYLLVEPNNTGYPSEDQAVHEEAAQRLVSGSYPTMMARELRIPLLVPTFPRPSTDRHIYTQALNRNTLLVTSGQLARIDLQLVQMIQDARKRLSQRGIDVQETVFMHGFSASGAFVSRFALLHPTLVEAYASGGFGGGYVTLPASTWRRTPLPYPVGVHDLQSIVGVPFDERAFARISRYLYLGEQDTNDCIGPGNPVCYDPEHSQLIRRLFPGSMQARWTQVSDAFHELAFSTQFVTYPSFGHVVNAQIVADVVRFFRDMMETQQDRTMDDQ